jgi:hypothetical protein
MLRFAQHDRREHVQHDKSEDVIPSTSEESNACQQTLSRIQMVIGFDARVVQFFGEISTYLRELTRAVAKALPEGSVTC